MANLPAIDVPTRTAVAPIPETAPEPVPPGGNGPTPLTRDEISEIQQRLEALGYDPGPVDGLMGERTGEAIAAFQQDRGLRADGQASADLLGRLRDVEPAS